MLHEPLSPAYSFAYTVPWIADDKSYKNKSFATHVVYKHLEQTQDRMRKKNQSKINLPDLFNPDVKRCGNFKGSWTESISSDLIPLQ